MPPPPPYNSAKGAWKKNFKFKFSCTKGVEENFALTSGSGGEGGKGGSRAQS